MDKMSMKIRRIIAILVTTLMISQMPGIGFIISGATDGPMISEPVGTLTYTCTAEDEGRTISMFYQSLANLIVPDDLGVTIGAVVITDSVNSGAGFTINNGGYIETANIQYGDVSMNGGTYTSITLAEGATINAAGITATSSITSSGSFNAAGSNVSNGSVTAVSIGGSGSITVGGKLELTGTGTTASLYVYTDTQIVNSTGAVFTVTNVENSKQYNIPSGTNSTLRDLYGVEVAYASADGRLSCTGGSDQFNTPIIYGETTDAITFTAAEGYYFPEDYTVTSNGSGTFTYNRVSESVITMSYTIAESDSGEVTINLPALKKIPVDGTGTITMDDVRYKEAINPQVTSITNDTTTPKYEYKQAMAADETYTTAKPTAVGDYVVRATLPANEEYNELVLEKEFSIIKAYGTVTFSVGDVVYGGVPNPQIASDTNSRTSAVVEYKLFGAPDAAYTITAPSTVGDYVARVTLAANESYEQVVDTVEFSILKAQGSVEFNVEDIIYGETLEPQVTSSTHDIKTAVVEYKLVSAAESEYKMIMPTAVGDYIARVTLATNESYEQVVKTSTFSINKAKGMIALIAESIVYGEKFEPQIVSDTNDVSTAVVEYKIAGTDDSTYSSNIVTAVGEYVVRVTLAANESYEQTVITDSFSIEKASGNGTIKLYDIYYGATVSPEISSGTNSVEQAVIEYKIFGAEDSTYSTTLPTAVGQYTARVTYGANESYNQVVATDDFVISYLPAPTVEVGLSGLEGTNGYYTTAVTINAPEGYLIADKLDGEYATSITVEATREAGYLYYKSILTGEKTAGVWCDEIMIDKMAPSISAEQGVTYYAEFVDVSIEDDNLKTIFVNGEEYTDIVDGKSIVKLQSNDGLEEYEIVIIDLAGNTKTMKVIVADSWMEQGVIPTGENVSLMEDYEYSLGDGTWQVEGDATSYNGNTTFYIGTEGEYTFIQQ